MITTPFGFSSTAAEAAAGIDLSGRRALVTGASSGLGAETGITANALMPGAVVTSLQRHIGGSGGRVAADRMKTVEQGAATSVLLAVSPLLEGVGGRYFDDCAEAGVVDRRTGTLHGVARYAVDPENARRLWDVSEALLADAAGAS
ncbi:hypothetical protein [Streptomyces sp. NPDC047061]|uniref:hypothetical protein n=1 Tax=Streptomyces sp. NPDC047061 TaxID=3154605 RepID=UPI0033D88FC1